MRLPTLTSLRSASGDGKGALTFQFDSADGRKHFVPIQFGALNAMLPLIVAADKAITDQGRVVEVQPITLMAARPCVFRDGRAGIELSLDGVPLRIAMDPLAIPVLQAVLGEAQKHAGGSTAAH